MARARRGFRMLAVGLGLTALVLVAQATDLLESWELDSVDARFAIRGDEQPPPELVTVVIDDKTFNNLPASIARWPFPRTVHARVLDRFREDGVRAVAYDVQFSEPSPGPQGPSEDEALVAAAESLSGRVVLATTEVNRETGAPNVFGGDPDFLRQIGVRAGHALFSPDEDGAIRRLPYEQNGLKTLALTGAEIALGRTIERSELPQNPTWIDYAGPPHTITSVPLSDVYLGNTQPGFFRDKVVLVGAAAPALQDLHETSTTGAGELMSGAEMHANALATALRGFPLSSTPNWFDFLLTLAAGLLVPLAGLRLSHRATLILAIGAGLLLLVAAQLAFNAGYVITFVYPLLALLALVLTTVGALAAHSPPPSEGQSGRTPT
jgi:adenylate cyclase